MEIGYSLFLAAVAVGFGTLIGIGLVSTFEHQGRFALTRQVTIAGVIALAVLAAPGLISGWAIYAALPMWMGWLGIAGVFSVALGASAFLTAYSAPGRAFEHMDNVSRVVPFALKNFDEIDYDDDQIISMKDLDRALMQKSFAGSEPQALLQFMRKNIHAIGHDVGSYHTGSQYGSTVTVSVINRGDIERYAAKMGEKYAGWRK